MRSLSPWAGLAGAELLVLGAHADDIEIGCGGTIRRWIAEGHIARVTWLVLSGIGARAEEAERSAASLLGGADRRVIVESFRDGFFPHVGAELKERFEALKAEVRPDIVLTHARADDHQDHRTVSLLTSQTFRDHLVLEYEVPKFDGDLGQPNAYVELSEDDIAEKARHILEGFPSQRDRHWFTGETFRSLARLRGIECRAASGYAEAFVMRKALIG